MLKSMLTAPRKEGMQRQPQTHGLLSVPGKGLAHLVSLFVQLLCTAGEYQKDTHGGCSKLFGTFRFWCSSWASSARLSRSYLEIPSFQEKAIIKALANFESSAKMADPAKDIFFSAQIDTVHDIYYLLSYNENTLYI